MGWVSKSHTPLIAALRFHVGGKEVNLAPILWSIHMVPQIGLEPALCSHRAILSTKIGQLLQRVMNAKDNL